MSSRLLIFGAGGQVGRSLIGAARDKHYETIGLSHAEADITDAAAVAAAMRRLKPEGIVNAAAYNQVDQAESEPELAFRVNRDGAAILAQEAAKAAIPLLHLSTDYVFDGRSTRPYEEDDAVGPLGVYARSKEEGERAVRDAAPNHVILRTAWVYSPFGANFVTTMLRLGAERGELAMVADQTGAPTSAAELAAVILNIMDEAVKPNFAGWGTYHAVGADVVTRYDFAEMIFAEAERFGMRAPVLRPVTAAEFPAVAQRPAYSVLSTAKLAQRFGIEFKPLRQGLAACLSRLFEGKGEA